MSKKTELVCIIDRSGSMQSCRTDAEGGFNRFIDSQKALDAPCQVTLHQFDTEYETVWPRQKLKDAGKFTLEPRGMTALLDAVGRTVTGMDPKPDRNVIVVIVTDGQENSSREFNRDQVKKLVKERQDAGWSFVFVGAGIDAFAEAGSIGVAQFSTLSSSATAAGYNTAYAVMDSAVETSRLTGASVKFTDEDRDQVE